MEQDFIVVLVSAGSLEEAERIAGAVVQEQLAACVNITAPVQSIYTWHGSIERTEEVLLIMKTRASLYGALEFQVRELHSYENPEIIALPIVAGSPDYLHWVRESTS